MYYPFEYSLHKSHLKNLLYKYQKNLFYFPLKDWYAPTILIMRFMSLMAFPFLLWLPESSQSSSPIPASILILIVSVHIYMLFPGYGLFPTFFSPSSIQSGILNRVGNGSLNLWSLSGSTKELSNEAKGTSLLIPPGPHQPKWNFPENQEGSQGLEVPCVLVYLAGE